MDEWTLHRKKGRELVLDYVIERKRMDDLASSIVDGRFLEQKFRFETAEIKQKIYLIENYGRIDNQRLDENALHAAIASTQVRIVTIPALAPTRPHVRCEHVAGGTGRLLLCSTAPGPAEAAAEPV